MKKTLILDTSASHLLLLPPSNPKDGELPLSKAAAALSLAARALAEAAGVVADVPIISVKKQILEPPIFKSIEGGAVEFLSLPTVVGLLENIKADPVFLLPNFTNSLSPFCFFGTLVRDRNVANEVHLLLGRSWSGPFTEKMNSGLAAVSTRKRSLRYAG